MFGHLHVASGSIQIESNYTIQRRASATAPIWRFSGYAQMPYWALRRPATPLCDHGDFLVNNIIKLGNQK